jgi:hypothetical protein
MRRRRTFAAAVLLAGVAGLAAGCGPDAICRSGEYPVIQVGGTGRACVANGDQPPSGFARFPSGQEPEHVDDKWDTYWRTHTVNAQGQAVSLDAGST